MENKIETEVRPEYCSTFHILPSLPTATNKSSQVLQEMSRMLASCCLCPLECKPNLLGTSPAPETG